MPAYFVCHVDHCTPAHPVCYADPSTPSHLVRLGASQRRDLALQCRQALAAALRHFPHVRTQGASHLHAPMTVHSKRLHPHER